MIQPATGIKIMQGVRPDRRMHDGHLNNFISRYTFFLCDLPLTAFVGQPVCAVFGGRRANDGDTPRPPLISRFDRFTAICIPCNSLRKCRNNQQSNRQQETGISSLRFANIFRIRSLLFLVILTSDLTHADTSRSSAVRPLYGFNQSPLIQIYGLPTLAEAQVLAAGNTALALRLQLSNNFTGAQSTSEILVLDGETNRLILNWRQGLSDGREWGFELPYVSHAGGFLDRYIEGFHDTFNLPQGGRTNNPRNQINYRYTRDGRDVVNVSRSVNGVGDLRLLAAKQLGKSDARAGFATTMRASLKLPTGKYSELLGSGSTDLAGWLSIATTRPSDQWNMYGGSGLMWLTEGGVIPLQQRNLVGFGTFGISQMFIPRVTVNAQLDMNSPFYDRTHFRQLNSFSVQGLAGLIWEFAPRSYLEFSITEDLIVDTSSDVVFLLSLTLPF